MSILEQFPFWILLLDYFFGLIMWLFILAFILNLFFDSESKFRFIKTFFNLINMFVKLSNRIIPPFLPKPIMPIYLAWICFMLRFYILPMVNGFDSIGYLSFPFENLVIKYTNLYILF